MHGFFTAIMPLLHRSFIAFAPLLHRYYSTIVPPLHRYCAQVDPEKRLVRQLLRAKDRDARLNVSILTETVSLSMLWLSIVAVCTYTHRSISGSGAHTSCELSPPMYSPNIFNVKKLLQSMQGKSTHPIRSVGLSTVQQCHSNQEYQRTNPPLHRWKPRRDVRGAGRSLKYVHTLFLEDG